VLTRDAWLQGCGEVDAAANWASAAGSCRPTLRFRCEGLAMIEAALLAVGLTTLAAAVIVVRRLTAIAARLVEVVEGLRAVREEIRRLRPPPRSQAGGRNRRGWTVTYVAS
jgi:hypothetical protein